MKKNLMTVIILALVLVNLVLTAILAFTIIPQTRKSNQLIDKIASAIDLELEDGSSKDTAAVPVEDIEVYDIEASFTVNLSPSGDGKDHVAVFSIGLSLNTKSDGYKSIGTEGLKAKETLIKNDINTIVSGYVWRFRLHRWCKLLKRSDGIDPNIVLGGEKEWVKSYLKMR